MYYEITNLQRNFTKQLKKNITNIQNIAYIAKHPPKLQLNLIDNTIVITARIDHMLYSYFKTFGILELLDNASIHISNICNRLKNVYDVEGVIILKYKILSYDKTRFIEDCKIKI